MTQTPKIGSQLFQKLLPWLSLFLLLSYTALRFFAAPYAGFRHNRAGEVIEIYVTSPGELTLQLGDVIRRFGGVSLADYNANPSQMLFEGIQKGESSAIEIERQEQILTIPWVFPGFTTDELFQRLNSEWWLPYIFWLAGVATLALVRPKDIRWRLLAAFNFLTAVWLAAGNVSAWQMWAGMFVFRSAVWLSLPVYLHLHWLFPRPVSRLPRALMTVMYGLAILAAAAEWLRIIPKNIYLNAFQITLVIMMAILVLRLALPRFRQGVSFLFAAVFISLTPIAVTILFEVLGISLSFKGGVFLALPTIPGAYFFTAYRQQLGHLQPRANRFLRIYVLAVFIISAILLTLAYTINWLNFTGSTYSIGMPLIILSALLSLVGFAPFLSLAALVGAFHEQGADDSNSLELRANQVVVPYLFFTLLGIALAILNIVTVTLLQFTGAAIVTGIISGFLAGWVTFFYYNKFQRWVEVRLLGLPLPPVHLLETFAVRVTASLTRESLTNLLKEEILPTLSVRQSALLFSDDLDHGHILYTQGVTAAELPALSDWQSLLSGNAQPSKEVLPHAPSWIRLALPLILEENLKGVWLLGRRDPDDSFARSEMPFFQALADQVTIAFAHILLLEDVQALYQSDIERNEQERARLALELHDETLNQLAVLSMYAGEVANAHRFQVAYQTITSRLRQIISGLRPVMLNYGLYGALEGLIDDLIERNGDMPEIQFQIRAKSAPQQYPEPVELHLFRIVQQAAENALRHAQATHICIGGQLDEGYIQLFIKDDGCGLNTTGPLNLAKLLASKHFGLAGIFERAALIKADVEIQSQAGEGTRIMISWYESAYKNGVIRSQES